ncbi:MAG: DUF1697 domain-containing protein [bacterium]|mgnify:CR=1 FL=1|jgi:uncharacterized protein (DUF1697 family)|nr:MAG: hypothetical protein DIU52_00040 [bacterium]
MQSYIALIRGLGDDETFSTKELVALLRDLGFEDVQTHGQSDIVFRGRRIDVPRLERRIMAALEERHGSAPRVIILTPKQLAAVIAANPFPEAEAAPASLYLTFLAEMPDNPDLEALERLRKPGERFALKGRVFYLHAPEGVGRSELFAQIEKCLGAQGTARDWRSLRDMLALAEREDRAAET